MATIRRCEPEFGKLLAAVVMDDHAHVLVTPHSGSTARRLASAWKGVSAHRLCGPGRRHSPLWQREYFDRWMVDSAQIARCRAYILGNPARRWNGIVGYPWVYPPLERRSPPL